MSAETKPANLVELVRLLLLFLVTLAACDGDGCSGGPSGAATRYCQQAIAGTLGVDGAVPPAVICKQCCIQEVPYEGRLEDGKCVCRR